MMMNSFKVNLFVFIFTLLHQASSASAQEASLPRIDVVGGSQEEMAKIPGSVQTVSASELTRLQPMSTEAALKQVPGVVIKPEEESAVVANIGMRGLSAGEYKTLILEDGVPVAADLFFGNSRYYNPRIQRMNSIEVLKGAASLRYGPNTIGGVINYKTKDPIDGASIVSRIGSHQYLETTLEAGRRSNSGDGMLGLVYTQARSDGFQSKDFDMQDLMIKGGMALGEKQWLGLKVTHYVNDAHISYRGLFKDAYEARATFNPAPDDWFLTDRNSVDFNHEWEISPKARLNTVVYWSEMRRDYWRFGLKPAATSLQNGLKVWNYSDSLDGNNRAFERTGLDTRLTLRHNSLDIANEAEMGVRWMKETMRDQKITATRANPRSGTLSTDVFQSASSLALFAQNRFDLNGQISVTPGIRAEMYEQITDDLLINAKDGRTSNSEYMPGVGATWQVTPQAQLYGGLYSAFSPPYNSTSIVSGQDLNLGAERSLNMEIGVRGQQQKWSYGFTAFRMNFDNQVIRANSNGGDPSNGGKTLHQGVELALAFAVNNAFHMEGNLTYVPDAKFVENRYSSTGTLIARNGNRVTYSPEWVSNLQFVYQEGPWMTALNIQHISDQMTDTMNTVALTENTSGFFTGRIDGYTTADLTSSYQVHPQLSLTAAVKNLADKHYIASLRQGIYAGPSRSYELGLKYKF
jgi:Fe(3+) dicitrate transport protein